MIKHPIISMGFDPGKKGGMASIRVNPDGHKEILSIRRMPLIKNEYDWIEVDGFVKLHRNLADANAACLLASIELIAPHEGSYGNIYSLHGCYEALKAIIAVNHPIKLFTPTPLLWKSHKMSFPVKRPDDHSIQVAKQRWPETIDTRMFYPSDRCKNESDGMADALLIAETGVMLFEEGLTEKLEKSRRKKNDTTASRTKSKSAAA